MPTNTMEFQVDLPLNLSPEEAKLFLALKLYEVGKVSLGQAAKMSGFSKRAFIEILGQHHIPVINYSAEEFRRELSQ